MDPSKVVRKLIVNRIRFHISAGRARFKLRD